MVIVCNKELEKQQEQRNSQYVNQRADHLEMEKIII